jgi:hypothetical protein
MVYQLKYPMGRMEEDRFAVLLYITSVKSFFEISVRAKCEQKYQFPKVYSTK